MFLMGYPRGLAIPLGRILVFLFFLISIAYPARTLGQTDRDEKKDTTSEVTLREALALGLEQNFSLRAERLDVPIGREDVFFEAARFHPSIQAEANASSEKIPTASAFSDDPYQRTREYRGQAGLAKTWRTGLESRVFLETFRQSNNSSVEGLDPQYRSFLVLDLIQPLLRDFGAEANTADLRIARNSFRQASLDYLNRARDLGARIEIAYYNLAAALAVLEFRREHIALTRELLAGNREKFEAGLIPISEVQEAETAVAARREEMIAARQDVESAANRLRDLLELPGGIPGAIDVFDTEPLPRPEDAPPDPDEAMASALRGRADLEAARIEIASRNIRLRFLANQKLPRLDIEGTLGVNGLSGDERLIEFGGIAGSPRHTGNYPESLERMSEADGYEWSAGLVFSYPLGNQAAEARYRQAGWRKRQAIYRLKRLENGIEIEIRDALATVIHARDRVEVAERFVELALETLGQEEERLRAGLSDTFRILRFQTDVIEARIRLTNALFAYNQGQAELYSAMGQNLERHGVLAVIDRE